MKYRKKKQTERVVQKTRKEIRKEQRQLKKAKRNEFFQRKKQFKKLINEQNAKRISRPNVDKSVDSVNKEKKGKTKSHVHGQENFEVETPVKRGKQQSKMNDNEDKITKKIKKELKLEKSRMEQERKLEKEMQKQRVKQLKRANEDEDKVIRKLEKQLKLNKKKRKSIPKSFAADGLDYLLEVCDGEKIGQPSMVDQMMQDSGSEFEEDLALIQKDDNISEGQDNVLESSDNEDTERQKGKREHESESENDEMEIEGDELGSVKVELESEEDELESDNDELESKKEELESDDEDVESRRDGSEDSNSDDNAEKQAGEEYWEDIYGRTRDKQGNVVEAKTGKYVPPHMRESATGGDKQLERLRRQLKGLLNRLAENNMSSIASQVEELYMSHSRHAVNEALTNLLTESLVAPVMTPERLIMEHALLVAVLHANVGTEVGAHVMQVFIKKFDEKCQSDQPVEDKSLDNILLVLSHLYNFKVFNGVLLYDILEQLTQSFGEKDVELILLVLRSVGFSLRKDDPAALKDLILRLQQKAGEASDLRNSTRVKFMLEVLLAIKNNNMTKIPNYDPTHSEHLKKIMKGFLRKGSYVTELKISLEDLLKADERGRWWVVGSAWSGVIPGGKQGSEDISEPRQQTTSSNYSKKLLELARKQRMNTDVRRNIFCILMTAEDFLDAFEKLLHMGLKNQQEREIIYVIMNCCLQEKKFNPYYCHLAQKFCDFDRKYQITIQCALWDRFKELQNLAVFQVTNLAKFLIHLLIEKGLPLSVLKVIHFAEVDQVMVRFLRQVLLGLLLHDSQEAVQEVFQRVAVSSKLHVFREGIRLFIHHFLLRNMSEADSEVLHQRAKMADKILSAAESRVMF
ncbi:nucleolar MIF4G domain-containing protein 1 [Periplaneta americana]|uniref:nucleolar MIF4G domain-containing protein 1 n=1 Tax=Periplaneta americana TaxID=6978 RepID=UPI0037E99E2C